MASPLDPQVKTFLEQFQANAAQQSEPDHIIPATEKIALARQMMSALRALGLPSEPVSRVEDFGIPGPAGKILARLYRLPDFSCGHGGKAGFAGL